MRLAPREAEPPQGNKRAANHEEANRLTAIDTDKDAYPTRVANNDKLIDRAESTVWGTEADGPMDAATLASHDTAGSHIVEGLLSPAKVQTYWLELARLSEDPQLKADERTIGEKRSGEVRSIFQVHKISTLISELVRDPRILDRARQILGSEVYIHQSRVNYMPGFRGSGFYWHSDFETWHAEDGMPKLRAVSCSIALTDNYPFNGGLMVMPGSQRTLRAVCRRDAGGELQGLAEGPEGRCAERTGHHQARGGIRDRPVHRSRRLGAVVRLEHHARL